MDKILVATDFSAPASNAVDYAAHLARELNSELILFNVFKLNIHASNSMTSSASINHLVEKSQSHLSELSQKLAERYNIKVGWELRKEDTIESLEDYTQNNPVDLVVMGIESNLVEYKLFGNTTTAAINLMKFPLLVVPDNFRFSKIDSIMYACESSYLKNGSELDIVKYLVRTFSADLNVLHVLTDHTDSERNEDMEHVLDEYLKGVGHVYRYVKSPRVGDGINQGLDQYPTDLLVMIPHRRGFFESLIKASNTNNMTVNTKVPILVIPNENLDS